ncbi:ATP-dependent Clp protease ATP-binding subunit ClpX, partial [Klebsiella pneumoniae]
LTKPKNAMVKQFEKLLEMDGAELEVRPSALSAIAKKAIQRKTGARGLRTILEQALLGIMYDLPGDTNVKKVVIDENTINGTGQPLLIYEDQPKVASSKDKS